MATLHELTQHGQALFDLLLSDEIDEETFKNTLEAMDTDSKIESYCKIIKNLEADEKAYKEAKDSFAAKEKTTKNAVKRMKEAVLEFMQATGQKKVKAGLFTVSKGTTTAVNITDETKLPPMYVIPQAPKIDKTAISKDIKAGIPVDGAELIENEHIRIK